MPTLKVTKYEGVKLPSSSWSPSLVSEAGVSAVCAVKVYLMVEIRLCSNRADDKFWSVPIDSSNNNNISRLSRTSCFSPFYCSS